MKIISDIQPEITVDEVCRLLGSAKGRVPSGRLRRNVERSILTARGLIRPGVLYTERKIERAGGGVVELSDNVVLNSGKLSGALRKCDRAAIFIATIGAGIDEHIRRLTREGKMAEACVFDAIGSVAAEDTVDKFHRMCERSLTSEDERTTLRFSPGYCDWKVREQEKIFEVMDNGAIGVHLGPSCLMTPRKSVSGVFGIAQGGESTGPAANPCTQCGMRRCAARRTGQ